MTGRVNTFRQIGYPDVESGRYNTAMRFDRLRNYVEEELDSRGWTMRELGRRAHLSHGTISNLLASKSEPTPDTLTAIAQALGEPPEKLFRMAGLLRQPRGDDEATVQDMIAIMRELTPDERLRVLEFGYFLLRQERQRGRADNATVPEEG